MKMATRRTIFFTRECLFYMQKSSTGFLWKQIFEMHGQKVFLWDLFSQKSTELRQKQKNIKIAMWLHLYSPPGIPLAYPKAHYFNTPFSLFEEEEHAQHRGFWQLTATTVQTQILIMTMVNGTDDVSAGAAGVTTGILGDWCLQQLAALN